MLILEVLIEYKSQSLDRPFSYLYFGNKNVGRGYRVLVEFNHRTVVGFVLKCEATYKTKEQLEEETGFSFSGILDVLDETPLLDEELLTLADKIAEYYLAPKISVFQTMLPSSLAPKSTFFKAPKIAYDSYVVIKDYSEENLTNKQIELLRLIKNEKKILKKDISSQSILQKLIDLNLVEIIKEEKRRLKIPTFDEFEKFNLTSDQKLAINEIIDSEDKLFLLKGITGSGKTEVYLNLIDHYLKLGKGSIFLVPEISLTPIMVEFLLKRFDKNVAILHSELTQAEKYDEYRRIANGESKIVIGARSAIFAPIRNLGLIVIDEEHVESYKQDNMPSYHARDVAIMRSKITSCKVVMGSATPSLETNFNAERGIFHKIRLDKRINNKQLPETQIINMLDVKNIDRDSYIFSIPLRKAIKETLIKGEQVILLLNRRGFSTNVVCRNCGHVFKCDKCNVSLTYHRKDNMLKCHHCDHVETFPEICPECGGDSFIKTGFGSEKVEEEVKRLFPEAQTLRFDSDSTKSRLNIPIILEKFRNKEANILIGTQMIAKGHDFPNVTLVGVVLADIGLNMPSYRSTERVFQLITQAVGRCGRGKLNGKAYIQTYLPNNYSILLGASQNYEYFYTTEIKNRVVQKYPPLYHLAYISVTGKNLNNVDINVRNIISILKEHLSTVDTIVLGPITPYIFYSNEHYEKQILIKYKNSKIVRAVFQNILDIFKLKSAINVSINIDPYNF